MSKLLPTRLPQSQGESVSTDTFNRLVRVLEINFIEHDETVRTTYGLTKINRKKTRHDVVEELKEQIKDAGKVNGE